MLPENIFDPFLRSLSLEEPYESQGHANHEAIAPSSAINDGQTISELAIRIWSQTGGAVTFDRFRDRLRDELRYAGHKSSDAVIGSILVLYLLHPDRMDTPTRTLNGIVTRLIKVELAQFFILGHKPYPGFTDFKIGTFSIGELKWRNLRNHARNAGSDFFARYKDSLIGRFAIERAVSQVTVLNWQAMMDVYDPGSKDDGFRAVWNRGFEAYYGALGLEYFEEFWGAFVDAQDLTTASGAPYMDQRQLRLTPFAMPVTIYLAMNGTWGFVSPHLNGGFVIDFASVDRRVPKMLEKLKSEFGIDATTALVSPLQSYVHFVSKAKRYSNDDLYEEAFLHYVIALELLFGEHGRTTEAVSSRVAALIFMPLQLSLKDAEQKLNKIYDARSRYVHQGDSVDKKLLTDVAKVSEEVLWAFLRRLRHDTVESDIVGRWTRELDYLYSALIADKAISDGDMRAAGIQLSTDTANYQ